MTDTETTSPAESAILAARVDDHAVAGFAVAPSAMIAHPAAKPRSRETFGRQHSGGMTRDRRSMAVVNLARTGSTPTASVPDPAAVAEAQRRFAICKTCEHSRDDGFACDLYHDCCFGRFRSAVLNHCSSKKW
jgi:hypothetical protein